MGFSKAALLRLAWLVLPLPALAADILPRPVFQNGHIGAPELFAFSHDGLTLASFVHEQGDDGLRLWDTKQGHLVANTNLAIILKNILDKAGKHNVSSQIFRQIRFSLDDKSIVIAASAQTDDGDTYDFDLTFDISNGTVNLSHMTPTSSAYFENIMEQRGQTNKKETYILLKSNDGNSCVAGWPEPFLIHDCKKKSEIQIR